MLKFKKYSLICLILWSNIVILWYIYDWWLFHMICKSILSCNSFVFFLKYNKKNINKFLQYDLIINNNFNLWSSKCYLINYVVNKVKNKWILIKLGFLFSKKNSLYLKKIKNNQNKIKKSI